MPLKTIPTLRAFCENKNCSFLKQAPAAAADISEADALRAQLIAQAGARSRAISPAPTPTSDGTPGAGEALKKKLDDLRKIRQKAEQGKTGLSRPGSAFDTSIATTEGVLIALEGKM